MSDSNVPISDDPASSATQKYAATDDSPASEWVRLGWVVTELKDGAIKIVMPRAVFWPPEWEKEKR